MTFTETLDCYGAFPRLSPRQIDSLASCGRRRTTRPGEILYREGARRRDFLVVLAGKVALLYAGARDDGAVGVHGRGRFLGELGLLTGGSATMTAIVCEAGDLLCVPVERLGPRVLEDPPMGDLILRAYLTRRAIGAELGGRMRIIGSRTCPDARRLRDFAVRNRVPHRWVDLDADEGARHLLRDLGVAPDETPIVIWRRDVVMRNPAIAEVVRAIAPASRRSPRPVLSLGAEPS